MVYSVASGVRESVQAVFERAGALCLTQARRLRRFATDPTYRSNLGLRFLHRGKAHQSATVTELDRYPDVFERCAAYFQGRVDLRILSFGCSTGEEVISLRKHFPHARIIGVDINRNCLRTCRQRPDLDRRMRFVASTSANVRMHGPYDAIFCMAVLQRPENREPGRLWSVDAYPFARFDAQVMELDAALVPGGLFAIDHADYAFHDSSVAAKYRPLDDGCAVAHERPLFDKSSAKIASATFMPRVFVKSGI